MVLYPRAGRDPKLLVGGRGGEVGGPTDIKVSPRLAWGAAATRFMTCPGETNSNRVGVYLAPVWPLCNGVFENGVGTGKVPKRSECRERVVLSFRSQVMNS